ncbi:Histidine kinase [Flagellimonas maritima]|uniref:Histidine kinase n=2 Tax=Flagellimonas maritima TaxID=1383885 RepID=A0A2Z4LTW6_9FLAO|nr:Histidine kinase [Allomuricauda aurantiaca]
MNFLLVVMAFFCFESVYWVQRRMLRKFVDQNPYFLSQSLIFISSIVIGTMVYIILFYGFKWIDYFLFHSEPPYLKHMVAASLVGLLLAIIFSLFLLITHWKDRYYGSYIRNEALKKEIVTANLNMLRNQLDPHFMFNNFNTLYYLIDEDPYLAKRFLKNVSSIYRHILQHTEGNLIPVKEEFLVVKQYLEILQERYCDGLNIQYNVFENHFKDKYIAPLALQELVENVFKHNQINIEKKLTLTFTSTLENLTLCNSVLPKTVTGSHKKGLQNIMQRYGLLTNKK